MILQLHGGPAMYDLHCFESQGNGEVTCASETAAPPGRFGRQLRRKEEKIHTGAADERKSSKCLAADAYVISGVS